MLMLKLISSNVLLSLTVTDQQDQGFVVLRFMRCFAHYAEHLDASIASEDILLASCRRRCSEELQCAKFTLELSKKTCFLFLDHDSVTCSGGNRNGRDFISGFKGLLISSERLS